MCTYSVDGQSPERLRHGTWRERIVRAGTTFVVAYFLLYMKTYEIWERGEKTKQKERQKDMNYETYLWDHVQVDACVKKQRTCVWCQCCEDVFECNDASVPQYIQVPLTHSIRPYPARRLDTLSPVTYVRVQMYLWEKNNYDKKRYTLHAKTYLNSRFRSASNK